MLQGNRRAQGWSPAVESVLASGYIRGDRPREPRQRPTRVFTTRPYCAGFRDRRTESIDLGFAVLTKTSPGYMVVLCEGRHGKGFYVCSSCGAGFRKRERSHKTPYGDDCAGTLMPVSLGHEFVTDVL